jgi:putative Mn2+ efflux pump MntP
MDIITILIIAVALSMDSFAVSVMNGLTIKNLTLNKRVIIASSLALFQSAMPLLGWLAGQTFEKYVTEFDHWVAFILLFVLGAKMIGEGFHEEQISKSSELRIGRLLTQSVATSIDAFAIGISFAILNTSITMPIIIIGVVTFICSILGLRLGKILGNKIGKSVEIIGGVVLILIGVKILIEHIWLS